MLSSVANRNQQDHPTKSFVDIINGPIVTTVPIKTISSFEGEPFLQFWAIEVQAMAAPFKLSLVGKFSYNRPPMEIIHNFFASLKLKGKSQVSFLNNQYILMNFDFEEDYSRLWVRQSWYNGSTIRIFQWTTDFRCSQKSPIVPTCISFPYLPVHFMYCKEALFSIALAIGRPLRVDQATASLSRPSVAMVLVEYDVTQPPLQRIRIGVGDSEFWQRVVFEKIPPYCTSCQYLGHVAEACYVTNPGFRPQRPNKDRQNRATRQKESRV